MLENKPICKTLDVGNKITGEWWSITIFYKGQGGLVIRGQHYDGWQYGYQVPLNYSGPEGDAFSKYCLYCGFDITSPDVVVMEAK